MTAGTNDPGQGHMAPTWRSPENRREEYWLLGSARRGFYICATAGPRDWRTALCVFDSEKSAEEHLKSLGDVQLFLDTLERYGAAMPGWMRNDPLLPEVRGVAAPELRRILWSLGVDYVTVNPPPAGERTEALHLQPAGNFAA